MAIDYGPVGPADDQVNCSAKVDDASLGPGDRTDLRFTVKRVAGPDTAVNVAVVLWNDPGGAATIQPPGTVIGPLCIGLQAGIPLPSNVERDLHFLVDNPLTGLAPATYQIIPVVWWTSAGPFVLGPTPNDVLG